MTSCNTFHYIENYIERLQMWKDFMKHIQSQANENIIWLLTPGKAKVTLRNHTPNTIWLRRNQIDVNSDY